MIGDSEVLVHNACSTVTVDVKESIVYRGGNDLTLKPGEVPIKNGYVLMKRDRQ